MIGLNLISSKIPKEVFILHKFIIIEEDPDRLLIGLTQPENILIIIEVIESYYDIKKDKIKYKVIEESELDKYILRNTMNINIAEKSIVEICDDMFKRAVQMGATDIHIEPYDDELKIRFRILGELRDEGMISKDDKKEFIARLKVISKLDVSEKRRPQDGRINLNIDNNIIDIRISILPLLEGEKIVLRVLDKNKFTFKISDLGLCEDEFNLLSKMLLGARGLILIAGPAGSGKTTTLYTILNHLQSENNNLMTIEDPVEYTFLGINQSQIHKEVGYTFEVGLTSILRQDPDIILVGELREEETSNLAVKAAETGHLVLSSIHTDNCASAIFRLLGMKIEKHLLISSLRGIISQRLVKILCNKCKREVVPSTLDLVRLQLDQNKKYVFYEARGCPHCINGYISRKPIFEIILVDKKFRRLLEEDPYIDDIKEHFAQNKVKSLFYSALDLLISGEISMEEVYKISD